MVEIEHSRKRPGGCCCRFFGVTTRGPDRFLIAHGRDPRSSEASARRGRPACVGIAQSLHPRRHQWFVL